jgi:hypothetical protein
LHFTPIYNLLAVGYGTRSKTVKSLFNYSKNDASLPMMMLQEPAACIELRTDIYSSPQPTIHATDRGSVLARLIIDYRFLVIFIGEKALIPGFILNYNIEQIVFRLPADAVSTRGCHVDIFTNI